MPLRPAWAHVASRPAPPGPFGPTRSRSGVRLLEPSRGSGEPGSGGYRVIAAWIGTSFHADTGGVLDPDDVEDAPHIVQWGTQYQTMWAGRLSQAGSGLDSRGVEERQVGPGRTRPPARHPRPRRRTPGSRRHPPVELASKQKTPVGKDGGRGAPRRPGRRPATRGRRSRATSPTSRIQHLRDVRPVGEGAGARTAFVQPRLRSIPTSTARSLWSPSQSIIE